MPHLVHEAYVALLKRGDTYEDEDWEQSDKWQRHAINAALDLRDALKEVRELREERDALKLERNGLWHEEREERRRAERAESALAEARSKALDEAAAKISAYPKLANRVLALKGEPK